ncbi:MAG: hypothetical protein AAF589_00405, partial [Planctomycetota bacterium]
MRMLGALIGYLCTATVLSAAFGFAYLWQTERLDDEKVFRIVALMHDVDIDALEAEETADDAVTPEEEPSLDDIVRYRAVIARNYEVKQDALRRGRQLFDQSYEQIKEEMRRLAETVAELDNRIQQEGELANKEAVSKVVRDIEAVSPDTGKELLRRRLKEPEGLADVIKLMNAMSTGKLKKILLKFRTAEELDDLHRIHSTELEGGPKQAV